MIDLADILHARGIAIPPLQIIDVGAMFIERQPWDDLVERGLARVLGFEPQPEEYARCNEIAGPNRRFLPYALGDGEVWPFHRCNAPMTSSMYPPNRALVDRFQALGELMQVVEVVRIPTVRLDDLPEAQGSDFIKLDTQGFELTILEHATTILQTAAVVQAEVCFVPLYQGQPLFADLDAFLRSHGFMLHTMLGISSRAFKPLIVGNNPVQGLRQCLWSDAVYVRDIQTLQAQEPELLLKLALLAHGLYGSVDLAAFALQCYDRCKGTTLQLAYLSALTGPTTAGTAA